ncbi:hypothetical protein D3C83_13400 [compost metagenome]
MPKRPGPSASSTSSDVAPASATSKSWMMPAPFIASADTKPRSIRSMITGETPVLITCAPMPQTMPALAARARTMASTTRLTSRAPSSAGSASNQAWNVAPRPAGRPKSATRALLARDASG